MGLTAAPWARVLTLGRSYQEWTRRGQFAGVHFQPPEDVRSNEPAKTSHEPASRMR